MESQIIITKTFCKGCRGVIKIEKCNDETHRWKIIFCENWCFTKETPKKKIKESTAHAWYKNINGESYLSTDFGKTYHLVEIRVEGKNMRVVRQIPRLL